MSRKSFVLHIDSLEILDQLSDEQKGRLFYAIYQYNLGNEIELDDVLKMAFFSFKSQFKRDEEKYKKKCEVNRANGSKGGKQKVANATERYRTRTNLADSDSDSDSDSNIKEKREKEKSIRFSPPSIEEIRNYCSEKEKNIDPESFYNFYQQKNWMVGRNKMKDWKASVNLWNSRNNKPLANSIRDLKKMSVEEQYQFLQSQKRPS
jgi:hypothetical protein